MAHDSLDQQAQLSGLIDTIEKEQLQDVSRSSMSDSSMPDTHRLDVRDVICSIA